MVTAELAVCLPVLLIVLVACIAAVSLVARRIQIQDAATEAARAVGRGDAASAAVLVERLAPAGAVLTVTRSAGTVSTTVRAVVHLPGGLGSYTVEGHGSAVDEASRSADSSLTRTSAASQSALPEHQIGPAPP